MGRYYHGDIEGKFWFAIQSSDDADFFGSKGMHPNILEYHFDEDNLDDIKKGINECKEVLSNWKKKLDYYFEENDSFNNEKLKKQINLTDPSMLEWYARLELGEKILKCVEEDGQCIFEAELG